MKKSFFALLFWLTISSVLGTVYLYFPHLYSGVEGQIRDIFFQYRGTESPQHKIVIVDIDEKSLAAFGQWPWRRDIIADLLRRLRKDGVLEIGLDMVFPEPDRTSLPLAQHGLENNASWDKAYDQEFLKSIRETTPVLGFAFEMDEMLASHASYAPTASIVEQGVSGESAFYQAKSMISNLPMFQRELRYSGFINMVPDASGIVRSMTLLMRFNDALYPSFDLEILRCLQGSHFVKLSYEEGKPREVSVGNIGISVSQTASVAINYRGASETYPYVSIVDILHGEIDPAVLKDAIVLVGTSAAGLVDLRPTPFDSAMPGIEIHANMLDNFLSGDFLKEPFWISGLDLLQMLLIFGISFVLFLFLDALWIFLLFILLFYLIVRSLVYMLFGEYLLVNVLFPFVALFSALFSALLIDYFYESAQKKRIKKAFAKKVSPVVIEELITYADARILQNTKREVTVFFSDIRNFTLITEELQSPKRLMELLNGYIAPMSHIITSHHGTIDKYIGDAIMAYWNAPQELLGHADAALNAAFEQLNALKILNKTFKEEFAVEVSIGIGLHTGEAIVGEIGSSERSDYTVIGHSVNLASRLENLNKRYGTHIIISDQTKKVLKSQYVFRELGKVHFRKDDPAETIYEVMQQGEADEETQKELDDYHRGLEYYYHAQWGKAYAVFKSLEEKRRECTLYQYYLNRIVSVKEKAGDSERMWADIL